MKIKINCLCPKGQAGKARGNFENYLFLVKKPIKSEITSEESFYFVYELKDDKELNLLIGHRIPKTIKRVRDTYSLIIHLVNRANKLKSKFNWAADKALRWARNRLRGKTEESKKDAEDLIKDITLDDLIPMRKFLEKDIITWELLEETK